MVVLCGAMWVQAQPRDAGIDAGQSAVRFAAVDVYIDSGESPLAAYQFELTATSGEFEIVGVEGGEHAAFKEAPYYDPAALHGEGRIIIAAFNTGDDLPTGKTRVARVHVRIAGETSPEYAVELIVSASTEGDMIDATVSVSEGTNP